MADVTVNLILLHLCLVLVDILFFRVQFFLSAVTSKILLQLKCSTLRSLWLVVETVIPSTVSRLSELTTPILLVDWNQIELHLSTRANRLNMRH